MKYLLLFEELYEPRDFVQYKGQRARVVSRDGINYKLVLMGDRSEIDVTEDEIDSVPKCLGRCDREVIGKFPLRKIYCKGCDRIIKRV